MINLYFQTTHKSAFLHDLADLGMVEQVPSPKGGVLLVPVLGVSIDYIGRLEQTLPVYSTGVPPEVVAPATYYPGERANVRLTGPQAESRAAALSAAAFTRGTVLLPTPGTPKRIWA